MCLGCSFWQGRNGVLFIRIVTEIAATSALVVFPCFSLVQARASTEAGTCRARRRAAPPASSRGRTARTTAARGSTRATTATAATTTAAGTRATRPPPPPPPRPAAPPCQRCRRCRRCRPPPGRGASWPRPASTTEWRRPRSGPSRRRRPTRRLTRWVAGGRWGGVAIRHLALILYFKLDILGRRPCSQRRHSSRQTVFQLGLFLRALRPARTGLRPVRFTRALPN